MMKKYFTVGFFTMILLGTICLFPQKIEAASKKVSSVTLNYNAYVLQPNQTIRLKSTCLPKSAKNKKVTWSSSRPSVAEVTVNGRVKAKKNGTTKITVKATDCSKKKAVCTIKVVKKIKKVKKIQISADAKIMKIGTQLKLQSNVKPKSATMKELYWKSSNEKVASITQKGVVKAKQDGKTTITAFAQDGSKKKATFRIEVKKMDSNVNAQKVTQIVLSDGVLNIKLRKKYVLKAEVLPVNATNKEIQWVSLNSAIASVSDTGEVSALAQGTTTIEARALDGSGIVAQCTVNVGEPEEVLANHHTMTQFIYELDRNAYEFKSVNTETNEEPTRITASEVAFSMFGFGFAVRNGITTNEQFYNFMNEICEKKALAVMGVENLSVKEHAVDFSSMVLKNNESEIKLSNIKILAQNNVVDVNGIATKASRIQFEVGNTGETLTLELYHNGNKIAIYRPTFSAPQFEFNIDNINYKYVIKMGRFFNSMAIGIMPIFPNFSKINMYNIY